MTDAPATPIAMKVATPAAARTIGMTIRRGEITTPNTSPTPEAKSTGVLTRSAKKPGIADGSSESERWRPRSSAEADVYCCENSGLPVTRKSTRAQVAGPRAATQVKMRRSRQDARQQTHSQYMAVRNHAS